MNEWKIYKLAQVAQFFNGRAYKLDEFKEKGTPIVRIQNLTGGGTTVYSDLELDPNKYIEKDDLIYAWSATFGPYIWKGAKSIYHYHIWKIKCNDNLADKSFLYYKLKYISDKVRNQGTGSIFTHITKSLMEGYETDFPLLAEQIAIGKMLKDFDSKIDLLSRQNQTLKHIAQTLFKRWFIDFEFPCLPQSYRPSGQVNLCDMAQVCTYKRVGGVPEPDGDSWFVYVLLCENGSFYKGMTNDLYLRFYEHYIGHGAKHTKTHKPVKIVHWEKFVTKDKARKREEELKTGYGRTWFQRQWEKSCQPTEQTSGGSPAPECKLRMAGKMVESELGEIPEGWKVGKLEDITEILNGFAFKSNQYKDHGVQVIRTTNFGSSGYLELNDLVYLKPEAFEIYEKYQLQLFDFLLVMVGASIGKSVIVSSHALPSLQNQNMWNFRSKIKYGQFYLIHTMRRTVKANISSASGSARDFFRKDYFYSLSCVIPSQSILGLFNDNIQTVFKKIDNNISELQTLTNTRDSLLPKLMSGQIRVPVSE